MENVILVAGIRRGGSTRLSKELKRCYGSDAIVCSIYENVKNIPTDCKTLIIDSSGYDSVMSIQLETILQQFHGTKLTVHETYCHPRYMVGNFTETIDLLCTTHPYLHIQQPPPSKL